MKNSLDWLMAAGSALLVLMIGSVLVMQHVGGLFSHSPFFGWAFLTFLVSVVGLVTMFLAGLYTLATGGSGASSEQSDSEDRE